MGDIERAAAALQQLLTRPPAAPALAARSAQYSLEAAAEGVIAALENPTG